MADEPVLENARPVCHRPLPPVRPEDESLGSILLFYQYVEPVWTKSGAFGRRLPLCASRSHIRISYVAQHIKHNLLVD